MERPQLIAEVKEKSPFGFVSDRTWQELFQIANLHGSCISVHTEEPWGGSPEKIKIAKSLTDKEILAKGVHETDQEIEAVVEAGADYVLVVGRVPHRDLRPYCWIEPKTVSEIKSFDLFCTDIVVWNSRDLENGLLKTETFDEAKAAFNGIMVQASNIKTPADVNPAANYILVGQHLPEFVKLWQPASQ